MIPRNRNFFILILAFYVLLMQVFILLTSKGAEVIYFCYNRQNFWTEFFKLSTFLGEWVGILGIGLYLLIVNRRALVSTLIAYIPLNILLKYLKKTLDFPRPLLYFKEGEISPIDGIQPLYNQSMPSGHTFTAFFCVTFLIFYFNLNRSYQISLFILATLVGLSRIYLMCHFVEDVYIGSILGIITGILSIFIYEKGLKQNGLRANQ